MLQEKVELLEQKLRELEAGSEPSMLAPSRPRKTRKTTSTVTSQQFNGPLVGIIGKQMHFDDPSAIYPAMSFEDAGLVNFIELFEPSGSPTLDTSVDPTIKILQPLSTNGSPLLPTITQTDHSNGSPGGSVRYSINTPSESDKTSDTCQHSKQVL